MEFQEDSPYQAAAGEKDQSWQAENVVIEREGNSNFLLPRSLTARPWKFTIPKGK